MSEFTATTVKFAVDEPVTGTLQFDQPRWDKFGNIWYALDGDRRFKATPRLHEMITMAGIKKNDALTILKYVEEGDDGKKYTPFKLNGLTYKGLQNGTSDIPTPTPGTNVPPTSLAGPDPDPDPEYIHPLSKPVDTTSVEISPESQEIIDRITVSLKAVHDDVKKLAVLPRPKPQPKPTVDDDLPF